MTAQDPVSPGRSISLKPRGGETGDSIMMFEETVPPGKKSYLHLHHDSDEVAYVLSGEVTFKIGDEVTVGGPAAPPSCRAACRMPGKAPARKPGACCFSIRRPGRGGLIEEQQRTGRKFGSMNERELAEMLQRHGRELLGPSPL